MYYVYTKDIMQFLLVFVKSPIFKIKNITVSMGRIYKKTTTKIEKEIESEIEEKISISEMITMIDRFIKGLESLNMSLN